MLKVRKIIISPLTKNPTKIIKYYLRAVYYIAKDGGSYLLISPSFAM